MSVESANAFYEKFKSDAGFRASIERAASDQDRQKLTKEAGFDFTKAEMKDVVIKQSELSEEDLEKVALGGAADWVAAGAGVAGAVAAAF